MSSLNNIIKITSSQGGAILASNPLIDLGVLMIYQNHTLILI